jgi:hypothetical protein
MTRRRECGPVASESSVPAHPGRVGVPQHQRGQGREQKGNKILVPLPKRTLGMGAIDGAHAYNLVGPRASTPGSRRPRPDLAEGHQGVPVSGGICGLAGLHLSVSVRFRAMPVNFDQLCTGS